MEATAKGILAKVVSAGLLAGAIAIAGPAAQAQQYGNGTYDRHDNRYSNNGYYANSYDRYDRFRDRDEWRHRREWERREAEQRRRFEHEQRERMKHGYDGYGWR